MLNERALALGKHRSTIREIFEYATLRKREIGEENVFDFSLGNPSVKPPESVNNAVINLASAGDISLHSYTSAPGDRLVRERLCENIKKRFSYPANPDLMYLTCGAAASLTSVLGAILNSGDEVLVFAPFFPEYKVFVESAGGKIKPILCDAPNFSLPLDKLKGAITERTRAVIINSPNNPTGAVASEKELSRLAEILRENGGIYLISDEPYRELCYDEPCPFVPNFYENTIVCYSYSKSLSLPGERIGYVLVGNECENASDLFLAVCGAARERGFVCAPSLFQRVVAECDGQTADISIYRQNRDLLSASLTQMGYTVCQPKGAFYLFVQSPESDAKAFCEKAKKFELMLVPSDDFGVFGWVRISYCVDNEMILKALPKFELLMGEYKND